MLITSTNTKKSTTLTTLTTSITLIIHIMLRAAITLSTNEPIDLSQKEEACLILSLIIGKNPLPK